jgi:hypothetical protein
VLSSLIQGQTSLSLASPQLLIGDERPEIAQLLRDHPYALFVVSNRVHDRWHFVSAKVTAPRLRRRIAIC